MVHSGIGIQYDGEFGLALESKNHKTAWVVDGILVFRRILVKESVLFPTGLWYRPSSPGKGWVGRLGISAYTYLCFRYKHSLPGSPGGRFGYKTGEAKEEQIQKKKPTFTHDVPMIKNFGLISAGWFIKHAAYGILQGT